MRTSRTDDGIFFACLALTNHQSDSLLEVGNRLWLCVCVFHGLLRTPDSHRRCRAVRNDHRLIVGQSTTRPPQYSHCDVTNRSPARPDGRAAISRKRCRRVCHLNFGSGAFGQIAVLFHPPTAMMVFCCFCNLRSVAARWCLPTRSIAVAASANVYNGCFVFFFIDRFACSLRVWWLGRPASAVRHSAILVRRA